MRYAAYHYCFLMRTIGLLGGMSWESSAEYYRIVNTEVKRQLGGLHSAKVILFSVDFAEIEKLQHAGNWEAAAVVLTEAANRLETAGAECLIICTNTMHLMADEIQAKIKIPIIHIADATAELVKATGISRVGLLGTRFTMEKEFYKGRLEKLHKLNVIIPEESDRNEVHRIIYEELCVGEIREESKDIYKRILRNLQESGAEGVILGCTEIELLVQQNDSPIPIFSTAKIHAESAVRWSLSVVA